MSIHSDENTTSIIQGITGRESVNMTRECLNYGSKVVGGVTPDRTVSMSEAARRGVEKIAS